jgi:hypothetical protein
MPDTFTTSPTETIHRLRVPAVELAFSALAVVGIVGAQRRRRFSAQQGIAHQSASGR